MIDYAPEFQATPLNVSRETTARLGELADLLAKWNNTINLVSKSTVGLIWSRHILDSMQIFDHGAMANTWADFGSGGGFPGLVVAIVAKEKAPAMRVVLVEADQRKAAFLRQASQALCVNVQVLPDRIEAIEPLNADVVSARAVAALPQLCAYAARHLNPAGAAVFLKGKSVDIEIANAQKDWNFSLESYASITDPAAVVLVLKGIAHV
jgi:16S rRNA (guanine527-N7)-methyltransferase